MLEINISRIHYPVTTLGPGRRIGIWFQGCSIRCEGCISVDTWRHGRGKTSVAEVIERLKGWEGVADGVTITGGEPFEQSSALVELVRRIDQEFDLDVLVYTGYPRAQVQGTLDLVAGCIDALVSEPFDHWETDVLPIRGSDNQILHFLTSRGTSLFSEYDTPSDNPTLDAMFDRDGTVWFCGIPKRDDLRRLQVILQSKGHTATFTAQKIGEGK